MNIPEAIGLLALIYLLNIVFVEFLNVRPYWMIFVPGLPLLKLALEWAVILCMIVLAAGAVILIAMGMIFCALWVMPTLWHKETAPEEGATEQPDLKIV